MTLLDFINSERERFANEDNNKFAMAFSQISQYSEFLDVVFRRYEEASSEFVVNTKAIMAAAVPVSHPLTVNKRFFTRRAAS